MRSIVLGMILAGAGLAMGALSVCAATNACPAGKPVTAFRLFVGPPESGVLLPIKGVNRIEEGDLLEYDPDATTIKMKGAKIAILLAADLGKDAGHIAVLEVKPADAPAGWHVPVDASVVAVVYGPHGLSEGKINTLVKKNPELVEHLSDYVEQTSKVEALVQTLSNFQQSSPGSSNLQAALSGFSKQYGVALPALNSGTSSDQQAQQLLQALLPALASDPLAKTSVTQQSTGLAASVATFFMGPQVGLAAGGAALLGQLHAALFPRAEFRSALGTMRGTSEISLCAKAEPVKAHTRVAYLWAVPVPNAKAPELSVKGAPRIPVGWKSSVEVKCASVSQLRLAVRARDWHLVSGATDVAVPVTVSVGPESDFLALDLTKVKLPAGNYHLAAKWDWTPMAIGGTVTVVNFADYSAAKVSAASRDRMVSGTGTVKVAIAGPDFEFLKSVSLVRARGDAPVERMPFSFGQDAAIGARTSITADLDTAHLAAGEYFVQMTQLNGGTDNVPVKVHPPNPTLAKLPIRVNLGEKQQTIELRGTSLGRIEKITSDEATWTLGPADGDAEAAGEREATVHLGLKAAKGLLIGAQVYVKGIHKPIPFEGVLRVAGPRPKIISARKSFATQGGVELRKKEIPENSEVSFAIQARNFDYRSRLHLACQSEEDTRQAVNLTPGERKGADELDSSGEGMLFLSLNAGQIGSSGCALMAMLRDQQTGDSDPYFLGQIIRLPQIDKFTLTDQKVGDAQYEGILTGHDLQEITKTGWGGNTGVPVENIPTPVPGQAGGQTLVIAMPWPPPYPGAPLYVWLSGETKARATSVKYQ